MFLVPFRTTRSLDKSIRWTPRLPLLLFWFETRRHIVAYQPQLFISTIFNVYLWVSSPFNPVVRVTAWLVEGLLAMAFIWRLTAIMRSRLKNERGKFFSLTNICNVVPWNHKPVCYQWAMLTHLQFLKCANTLIPFLKKVLMSPFRAEQLEGNYNLDLNEFFYFQLHACALTTSVTYLVQQSLPLHTSIILTTQLFSSGPRTEKLHKMTKVSTC